jgi:hypothetical protein
MIVHMTWVTLYEYLKTVLTWKIFSLLAVFGGEQLLQHTSSSHLCYGSNIVIIGLCKILLHNRQAYFSRHSDFCNIFQTQNLVGYEKFRRTGLMSAPTVIVPSSLLSHSFPPLHLSSIYGLIYPICLRCKIPRSWVSTLL